MAMTGKELGEQRALPFSRITEQTTAQYAFSEGVTKRELFAGLALMGLAGANDGKPSSAYEPITVVAERAAAYAYALCEALAKDGAP
jgi:hypothetical protein